MNDLENPYSKSNNLEGLKQYYKDKIKNNRASMSFLKKVLTTENLEDYNKLRIELTCYIVFLKQLEALEVAQSEK